MLPIIENVFFYHDNFGCCHGVSGIPLNELLATWLHIQVLARQLSKQEAEENHLKILVFSSHAITFLRFPSPQIWTTYQNFSVFTMVYPVNPRDLLSILTLVVFVVSIWKNIMWNSTIDHLWGKPELSHSILSGLDMVASHECPFDVWLVEFLISPAGPVLERIFVPKAYRGNLNSWMMSCWIWDNAGWMPDGLPFTAVWRIIEGTRWCPRSFAKLALNWLNCWVYSDFRYSYGKTLWFARKIRTVVEHSPSTCSNTYARPVFWYFPDKT